MMNFRKKIAFGSGIEYVIFAGSDFFGTLFLYDRYPHAAGYLKGGMSYA